ncbi:MAG: ribosomal protein S18-alanine N-acetyltransferase [Lachnospiraceae bacterium]|jgi:ribosomal-protein-alanine N-acetyltransferase|nr:ribosomal protein S18-alanine N-acetyltransferase [Lachnospiraceae bacterium]
MRIEIRELQDADIEILAQMEAEAFSMPWTAQDFRGLLERSYCFYLVALADGEIAGCCGYTDLCGEADIDNVVVGSRYRNQGVAQAMLEELIARGEARGVEAFTLEVRVSNAAAIHIYQKYGFRSEGIRPGFYEKPREDAMIMWRRKFK